MSEYLVFGFADDRYGIGIESIEEVQRLVWLTPVPEAPGEVCGVLDLHGRAVAVIDPADRLGGQPRALRIDDYLLIMRAGGHQVALCVHEVLGVVAGTPEPSPPEVQAAVFVEGILEGEGGLITVINPDLFLRSSTRAALEGLAPAHDA